MESVDLLVDIPERLAVHPQMLERPPNAADLLDDSQVEYLNALADRYSQLAGAAFEYWIRVLRWKSMNGALGRPHVRNHHSGWATYIRDRQSAARVWAAPGQFTAFMAHPIQAEEWEAARRALGMSLAPPLYYDLYFEGIEQRKNGEFQRAVVDFAVACEVLMRSSLRESLPTGLAVSIEEYRDDVNIRPVMTKFVPDLLSDSGGAAFRSILSKLHQLFNAGNELLHSGSLPGVTESTVSEFQEATKELIDIKVNPSAWK